MAKSVSMVGIAASELRWLRLLLLLLRHSDPNMPELTRQALLYLADTAQHRSDPEKTPLDHAG
jgi:hypothetical protein